tara:strand:+ start:130 stop:330 length:201 start_codon:yes stop_codon:yes gene_type:complete
VDPPFSGEVMRDDLRKFVVTLLVDKSGISDIAWEDMNDYLQNIGEFELLGELARIVREVDGRFYIN